MKILLIALFLFSANTLSSQSIFMSPTDSTASDSTSVSNYKEFRKLKKRAMKILLAWGVANTVGGLVGQSQKSGNKDFWTMNAGWGAVNAAIAGASLLFDKEKTTQEEQQKEIRQFSKILAINAGLDVGYMATGIAMKNASRPTTQQFGNSVVLQGLWLFGFDAILYKKSKQFHLEHNIGSDKNE